MDDSLNSFFSLLFLKETTLTLTESASRLLVSALRDMEEAYTEDLYETALSTTGCLKNVLKSASGSYQAAQNSQFPSKVTWFNPFLLT